MNGSSKILKSSKKNVPERVVIASKENLDTLVSIFISIGRIELAKYYAHMLDDRETLIKVYAFSFDFDSLIKIAIQNLDGSLNAFEFIICGFAIIEREEWELFDRYINVYQKKHNNQVNLVHGHYNIRKGNVEIAKTQLLFYRMQLLKFVLGGQNDFFHPAETIFTTQDYHFNTKNGIESEEMKRMMAYDLRELIKGGKDYKDRYVYWPLKYAEKNRIAGHSTVFQFHLLLLKEGIGAEDNYLIRMPNRVLPVVLGTIRKLTKSGNNDNLNDYNDLKNSIEHGETLFNNGIYGKKLTEDQAQASYLLHMAWFYYWNAGKLRDSLSFLNESLKYDKNFYDALILRCRVYLALGELEKAKHDFDSAQQLGPLPKKTLSDLKYIFDARLHL